MKTLEKHEYYNYYLNNVGFFLIKDNGVSGFVIKTDREFPFKPWNYWDRKKKWNKMTT